MGGHASGQIASKIAVDNFISIIKKNILKFQPTDYFLRNLVNDSYFKINKCLTEAGLHNKNQEDMGTTLTSIIFVNNFYIISSIGDSRLYKISDEEITQLTVDHSAGVEALRNGLIDEIIAKKSHYSRCLTKYLGSNDFFPPDIFPNNGFMEAKNGEIFLLCTDGVSGILDELTLYENVLYTPNITLAANNIIIQAFNAGSKDNMSIALIEYGKLERKTPFIINYKIKRTKSKKIFIIILIAAELLVGLILCDIYFRKNMIFNIFKKIIFLLIDFIKK